jgi:hypothetical protein
MHKTGFVGAMASPIISGILCGIALAHIVATPAASPAPGAATYMFVVSLPSGGLHAHLLTAYCNGLGRNTCDHWVFQ